MIIKKFIELTDRVTHRGPDGSGYEGINSKSNCVSSENFDIFLGHRRLSIIDLSNDGLQPMQSDDLHIIFNGEIFNYLELKEDLIKKGHVFRTKTDTEVILKLYIEYGEKGFDKLNGMWAFVLVDIIKSCVVISRDRFSIKPLFYLRNNNKFYFASEIKQLLPLLKQNSVNLSVMYKFLHQGMVNSDDQSFYNEIYSVKPKTNFIINLSDKTYYEESYWDYQIEEIVDIDYAINKFKELLENSVKIRLRSDVNIGALLSGGLDSSVLSYIADSISDDKFETYSIISESKKFSEEKFIDILARENNIKNTKINFKTDYALGSLEEVLRYQDEPFGSFAIVAQNKIYEIINKNTDVKVVLSGQGGDEILMGYLKFFFIYLKELRKYSKYHLIVKEVLLSLLYRTVMWQFNLKSAKRYIPSMANNQIDFLALSGQHEDIWSAQSIQERQILDIDKYSVPALTRYEDKNSMAQSLETRLPFLDHRLVCFCLSLKTSLKINNGWTKYILRKAYDNKLPSDVIWRRDKKGFSIPESQWLKNDLKEEIFNTFDDSMLQQHDIIDEKKFLQTYRKFLNNNHTVSHNDILRVYITENWLKNNF